MGGRGGGVHSKPPLPQERVGGIVFKRKQLNAYRRMEDGDNTTLT